MALSVFLRVDLLGRNVQSINAIWDLDVSRHVIDLIRDDNLRFLRYFEKHIDYWGDLFS